MSQRLRATYHGGIFVPDSPCDLPEGTAVDLIVPRPALLPPEVTDPAERERILAGMIERMQKNPIPPDAPTLDRESLLYSEDLTAYPRFGSLDVVNPL